MIEKLKAFKPFNTLDAKLIEKMGHNLTYKTYKANQVIYHAGDTVESCFIIDFGAVKLVKPTAEGKDIIMRFCSAGELIGAAVMQNPNAVFPVTSQTTEDTGIIIIPKSTYVDIWQKIPEVADYLNSTVVKRLLEFQQDKAQFPAPVAQKVATFLLHTLKSNLGEQNTIKIKLSRKDIAERVGTTVETVIRIMSQWTNNGWISTEDQIITIKNPDALEELIK